MSLPSLGLMDEPAGNQCEAGSNPGCLFHLLFNPKMKATILPERRFTFRKLHGVITLKIDLITIAVRISNST
jgi:hypothetical protein